MDRDGYHDVSQPGSLYGTSAHSSFRHVANDGGGGSDIPTHADGINFVYHPQPFMGILGSIVPVAPRQASPRSSAGNNSDAVVSNEVGMPPEETETPERSPETTQRKKVVPWTADDDITLIEQSKLHEELGFGDWWRGASLLFPGRTQHAARCRLNLLKRKQQAAPAPATAKAKKSKKGKQPQGALPSPVGSSTSSAPVDLYPAPEVPRTDGLTSSPSQTPLELSAHHRQGC